MSGAGWGSLLALCRKRTGTFTVGLNLCNNTAYADASFLSWYDANANEDGGLSWFWGDQRPDVWTAESRCARDFCQTLSTNKPLSGGIGR